MGFLLPDTDEMYAVANRISAHAAGARHRAGELGAVLGATDWHGLAADAFDAMAYGVLASMRTAADRLDDAAAALRRHAGAVAEKVAELAAIAGDLGVLGKDLGKAALDTVTDPGELVHDAGTVASDAGGLVADGAHLLGIG
jgi:uncharacterized protein YukE